MSKKADIKKMLRRLRRSGWDIEQGRTHYKAHHPKGGFIVLSVSPSCSHAVANMKADIRRLEQQHRKARK